LLSNLTRQAGKGSPVIVGLQRFSFGAVEATGFKQLVLDHLFS